MSRLAVQRFDFGWTDPLGGHDLICAWDGDLPGDQLRSLIEWSDSTRHPFDEHWYWVALDDQKVALLRVSPQLGGARGCASTTQAIVANRRSLLWGTDTSRLMTLFPAPPIDIGARAEWQRGCEIDLVPLDQKIAFTTYGRGTASLMSQLFGACKFGIPPISPDLVASEEVAAAMKMFSLCPPNSPVMYVPCFATRSAPINRMRSFRFQANMADQASISDAIIMWLLDAARSDPSAVPTFDPNDLRLSLQRLTDAIFVSKSGLARAPTDQVRIALSLFGFIDGNRESLRGMLLGKLEDKLNSVDVSSRSEFVLLVLTRRREFERVNVPPLWPLRLLCHKETLEKTNITLLAPLADELVTTFPGLLATCISSVSVTRMTWLHVCLTNKLQTSSARHSVASAPLAELVEKVLTALTSVPVRELAKALPMAWEMIAACVQLPDERIETYVHSAAGDQDHSVRQRGLQAYRDVLMDVKLSAQMLDALASKPNQFVEYLVNAVTPVDGNRLLAVSKVVEALSALRRDRTFLTLRKQIGKIEEADRANRGTTPQRMIMALLARIG